MSILHEYNGEQNIQEALEELCRVLIRSGLLTAEVEIIDNGIDSLYPNYL
ncbi:hypothetical protein [Paenibacillus sp. FSL L8-0333]